MFSCFQMARAVSIRLRAPSLDSYAWVQAVMDSYPCANRVSRSGSSEPDSIVPINSWRLHSCQLPCLLSVEFWLKEVVNSLPKPGINVWIQTQQSQFQNLILNINHINNSMPATSIPLNIKLNSSSYRYTQVYTTPSASDINYSSKLRPCNASYQKDVFDPLLISTLVKP